MRWSEVYGHYVVGLLWRQVAVAVLGLVDAAVGFGDVDDDGERFGHGDVRAAVGVGAVGLVHDGDAAVGRGPGGVLIDLVTVAQVRVSDAEVAHHRDHLPGRRGHDVVSSGGWEGPAVGRPGISCGCRPGERQGELGV